MHHYKNEIKLKKKKKKERKRNEIKLHESHIFLKYSNHFKPRSITISINCKLKGFQIHLLFKKLTPPYDKWNSIDRLRHRSLPRLEVRDGARGPVQDPLAQLQERGFVVWQLTSEPVEDLMECIPCLS